jgi:DNA-3-methyladenine glycosylase II
MTKVRRENRPKAAHHIIESIGDLKRGVIALKRACPHMRQAHMLAGDPPLRRMEAGFEGLARIIVGQQLSVASASAIWARSKADIVPFEAWEVASRTEEQMKSLGLSRPKIKTLQALARSLVEEGDWLSGLGGEPEAIVRERLTAVSGIGPWTADVYVMFCLGRADAFAPGDLALQIAAEKLMALGGRPSPQSLSEIAERWQPWRGVAARLLWAYCAVQKKIEAGAPV